jgi:hypothetical protein
MLPAVRARRQTKPLLYPWPLWVAGPWGAILLAVSVAISQGRRGGQAR